MYKINTTTEHGLQKLDKWTLTDATIDWLSKPFEESMQGHSGLRSL